MDPPSWLVCPQIVAVNLPPCNLGVPNEPGGSGSAGPNLQTPPGPGARYWSRAAQVIRVFDARTGQRSLSLRGHRDNVRDLLLLRAEGLGPYLVSASADHSVRTWDLRTCKSVATYNVHHDSVCAFASIFQPSDPPDHGKETGRPGKESQEGEFSGPE